ncbi:MAG TPA: hypothetical protein VFB12_20735 [Ktedonobacteraceae bacterium]|nr:hypothetical protein [Ktedonobacteraceae bacterium]
MDDPIVTKRLKAAWKENTGQGAKLLGILSITVPDIVKDLQLPAIETQKESLRSWLTQLTEEQRPIPYDLALTLHGLRIYDELEAQAIICTSLNFSKALHLFEEAQAGVIVTVRSMTLLREIHDWLTQLSM